MPWGLGMFRFGAWGCKVAGLQGVCLSLWRRLQLRLRTHQGRRVLGEVCGAKRQLFWALDSEFKVSVFEARGCAVLICKRSRARAASAAVLTLMRGAACATVPGEGSRTNARKGCRQIWCRVPARVPWGGLKGRGPSLGGPRERGNLVASHFGSCWQFGQVPQLRENRKFWLGEGLVIPGLLVQLYKALSLMPLHLADPPTASETYNAKASRRLAVRFGNPKA